MNLRSASKGDFACASQPTHDNIRSGSLQRIADATEAMAKNFTALQADCDRYKRWYEGEREQCRKLRLSNIALRAWLTRLKRALAKVQQDPKP